MPKQWYMYLLASFAIVMIFVTHRFHYKHTTNERKRSFMVASLNVAPLERDNHRIIKSRKPKTTVQNQTFTFLDEFTMPKQYHACGRVFDLDPTVDKMPLKPLAIVTILRGSPEYKSDYFGELDNIKILAYSLFHSNTTRIRGKKIEFLVLISDELAMVHQLELKLFNVRLLRVSKLHRKVDSALLATLTFYHRILFLNQTSMLTDSFLEMEHFLHAHPNNHNKSDENYSISTLDNRQDHRLFILLPHCLSSDQKLSARIIPLPENLTSIFTNGQFWKNTFADSPLKQTWLRSHRATSLFESTLLATFSPSLPQPLPIALVTAETSHRLFDLSVFRFMQQYADRNGYHFHMNLVGKTRPGVNGIWNKLIVLERLLGGTQEKWLFWVDSDVVIMNESIRLEHFIEATLGREEMQGGRSEDVNMIVSKDCNGLNTGAFFLRVSAWSRMFLRQVWVASKQSYSIEMFQVWQEQAAMMFLLKRDPRLQRHIRYVPQHWFNSYGIGFCGSQYVDGDFLVHFPSDKTNMPSFIQKRIDSQKNQTNDVIDL